MRTRVPLGRKPTKQGNGSSPALDDDPDEAADNAEPSALEEPESTSDSESAGR